MISYAYIAVMTIWPHLQEYRCQYSLRQEQHTTHLAPRIREAILLNNKTKNKIVHYYCTQVWWIMLW